MKTKKPILIICEGDSEYAYVQELNRYLNEQRSDMVLVPKNAGGGYFTNIRQYCRALKTKRNGCTFVLADEDIYFRDDNHTGEQYEKEKDLVPPFVFQRWNFEEFLLLHCPREIVLEWIKTAELSGHLTAPKHSQEFLPLFQQFCENHKESLGFSLPYEKGDMPFELTAGRIATLVANSAEFQHPHTDLVNILNLPNPTTLPAQ